jgi:hypothetical protein
MDNFISPTQVGLEFTERRYSAWYNLAGKPASSTLLLLHTSLSSVKFCISLSEVDYFHTLWKETLLNHVVYFLFVFVFIKKNSLPSSSEVKNEWCCTSTIPRDLHGVCRGHFTFTICFKISFHACCAFGGYLLRVLPVHFRFLEQTRQLTLKMDSAVDIDIFVTCNWVDTRWQ